MFFGCGLNDAKISASVIGDEKFEMSVLGPNKHIDRTSEKSGYKELNVNPSSDPFQGVKLIYA